MSDWMAAIRLGDSGCPTWRARTFDSSSGDTLRPSPTKTVLSPNLCGGSADVDIVNPRSAGPVSVTALTWLSVSGP